MLGGLDRTRRRTATLVGLVIALCALVAAATVRADDDGTGEPDPGEPAIEPGQEALLAEMLGKGATLPDGCELTDGQTEYAVITATYTCRLGIVVVELVHASHAEPAATQTEHFALMIESGSPPASLMDALAALVHAREDDFEWTWNTPAAPGEEDDEALPGTPG